ncbi:phosphatase PAP2 family protein [Geodermatophilus sabuli]|uniref:Phosphatase PAP2 family protein n=1 Tax=Geodermatophilus sabuli TaxID=1564158 RepID=A0A7K3VX00_9ACTN|nr:phosphatase PAP2 family protein [Geodermatophilus sabuli]NEK57179.1 phosphatase PAP2 family protein [Geodermatophilus sabuli]
MPPDDVPASAEPVVAAGRPSWWALAVALLVTVAVTADLLSRGILERMDLRVSEVVSAWDLKDSAAYWPVWAVTQLGGRGFILIVLAVLVGYLAWWRRTVLPLVRVLVALALLTVVVYGFKYGTGRTAPAYPGSFFYRDGASYPSGHVANAVLMWGVARWQAVEFGLAPRVQRTLWWLAVSAPVATGIAMVSLDFHWVTDAVVGAAVGLVLLGVVHALDGVVLSRWVGARAGRPSA